MENTKRHLQTTDWKKGRGMAGGRNTAGVLLDRQRHRDLGRDSTRKNRLEWKC